MKKFKFKIRGNSYEVNINRFEGNEIELEVNGTPYHVEIEKEIKKSKTPTLVRPHVDVKKTDHEIKKSHKSGTTLVKSPLPGTVMKIHVKVGDAVKKGQNLLVMEAMKMENNVTAEKDGVIKAIKVGEGESVLQNDILIEIE